MKSDPNEKTILASGGGSIETSNTIAGAKLNITHPSGSNLQFGDNVAALLATKNYQELVEADSFSTVKGDRHSYVKGTTEIRNEGDQYNLVGPTSIVQNEAIDEWIKEYQKGIGALKSQWRDNRFNLDVTEYPTNTVYSAPAGLASVTVCPPLLNGTAEDNKNGETRSNFEKKMMDQGTQDTQKLQKTLNETYSNFNSNAQALYNLSK